MIEGMTEQEFIYHPDTVDFFVRKSPYVDRYIGEHPELLVRQTLLGQYLLVYTHRDNMRRIIQDFGSGFISSASVILGITDRAELEDSGIIAIQNQPYLNLSGRGVLLGFVDTGIDYTKDVFLYEDGTSKIQYLYDQTEQTTPPEGFTIGKEYTNAQINAALQAENPYEIVPQRDTAGHGTFLASVAAGRKTVDFIGAAPDAELVVVKLRRARPYYLAQLMVPPEQEEAYESSAVMVGVEYILTKARELGRPVVICLGVGSNYGGHDGYSLFEDYLRSVAQLRGVCLVTSAGNESQAQHHARGRLNVKDEQQNLELRVGEDGDLGIVISLFNSAADRFSVSIRSPTGELVRRIPAKNGLHIEQELVLEPSMVEVEYFFPLEETGAQITIIRIFQPTPGIWTVTVHGDIVLSGIYHAWLPMTGFSAPSVQFLNPNPYYTVVVPATMRGSVICGAYDSRTETLSPTSSWGPTRVEKQAPDLVAPGVDVGGVYPMGRGSMSGTSPAAAITAGAAALLMQWGVVDGNEPSMSTYQVRALLIRGCDRSADIVYPNEKWGYGSLNLLQAFNLMREVE